MTPVDTRSLPDAKLVELPLDSCVDDNLFLQAAADGVPCDFQIEPALEPITMSRFFPIPP